MPKNDSLNGTTLPLRKIRQRESAVPKHRYGQYQIADIITYALGKFYFDFAYVLGKFYFGFAYVLGKFYFGFAYALGSKLVDGR